MTSPARGALAPASDVAPSPVLDRTGAAPRPLAIRGLPPARAGAGAEPRQRRLGIWTALRVLAFLDILGLHLGHGHALLGVGLPLFGILTIALAARRSSPRPVRAHARVCFRRLLVPWAAWSVAFGVLLAARAAAHGGSATGVLAPRMLLQGTEVHLWFIPFAAAANLVAVLLDRWTQRVETRALVAACVASAVALLVARPGAALPAPLGLWAFSAPAIPLGLALGRMLARPGDVGRRGWAATFALAAGVAFASAALAAPGAQASPAVFRFAFALALLALGPLFPAVELRLARALEPLMFGAYLLHLAVNAQLGSRLLRLAQVPLPPWAHVLLTAGLTLAVVAAMRRTPLRALL